MNQDFELLTRLIRSRRSVYPPFYRPEKIDKALITGLLENATAAPTHKRTEPWRFAVLTDNALGRLSDFMSEDYKAQTPAEQYSEVRHKKAGERALQSSCVIAVCVSRSPALVLPAWEETAAVACAVQNLWLSATAAGLAGYWSTPPAISRLPVAFGLPEGWECMGLFYLGWKREGYPEDATRKPVGDVSVWLGE